MTSNPPLDIEKAIAHAVSVVEGEAFLAYLFPPKPNSEMWLIGVIRVGDGGKEWRGWAAIPWRDYAEQRLSELEYDTDVIDLIREWGIEDEEVLGYYDFIAKEGMR